MEKDILSDVFRGYIGNRNRTAQIASHLDAVIQAALRDESGADLENSDGFTATPADRQISTICTKEPDTYGEGGEVVIEIFSEGRGLITASRRSHSSDELLQREERTIYFDTQEHPSQIASRLLSALVDIQENPVCDAIKTFVKKEAPDNGARPASDF
tara:strand:- start:4908 stop:5381 length:474 start_codon:yes stop_codon:yes gene_type:complete